MNFDPSLHHDNGYTPLAYAAMRGSLPMIELLLATAPTRRTTQEGDTPVELALRFGHAEVADGLKLRGARRRRPADSEAPGTTPASSAYFFHARRAGSPPCGRRLLYHRPYPWKSSPRP